MQNVFYCTGGVLHEKNLIWKSPFSDKIMFTITIIATRDDIFPRTNGLRQITHTYMKGVGVDIF